MIAIKNLSIVIFFLENYRELECFLMNMYIFDYFEVFLKIEL